MDKEFIEDQRPRVMASLRKLEKSTDPDDMKGAQILTLFIERWETEERITLTQIAELLPYAVGYHELWENKRGGKRKDMTRVVRAIIEKVLRKQEGLPVLAQSGKKNAGHWLARAWFEVADYTDHRTNEIESVYKSSRETVAAILDGVVPIKALNQDE